ncbi:EF-P lysine aminoacylase EpmA [Aliikangiella maris]|uniref:EF-P lysine aminoacylase EpmA n=2 Tax=Aliikangiella maris TaxID=3162458 RepID=A0ABV2BXF8_9GAMM
MQSPAPVNNILLQRATALRQIRDYFKHQSVLEVDTPLLADYSVTDPYMSAMQVINPRAQSQGYLQTSPEYAMKKLLCAGSGDIFQLGKVFRADEDSPSHSNEFTMLEWYRCSFSLEALMSEVLHIIQLVVGPLAHQILSYRQAFIQYLAIDPFNLSLAELEVKANRLLGDLPQNMLFDNYLSLLFATQIEPLFPADKVTLVTDFPASQAALARKRYTRYGEVACRFEAYSGGLELANGFYELSDPNEQLLRFEQENQIRQQLGYLPMTIDFELIKALEQGLPDCCGVALGFDRLLMLKSGAKDIKQVLPMSFVKR